MSEGATMSDRERIRTKNRCGACLGHGYISGWPCKRCDGLGFVLAKVDDSFLLAAVRSGVESGTIEGREIKRCTVHRADYDEGAPGCVFWMFAKVCQSRFGTEEPRPCVVDQFGTYFLIGPVSDGGSET